MLSNTVHQRAEDLTGALARLRDRLERTQQLPDLLLASTLLDLDKMADKVEKRLAELTKAASQLPFSDPPASSPSTNGVAHKPRGGSRS